MSCVKKLILPLLWVTLWLPLAFAESPEHFYNPTENLNPDPNYVPGDFPLADTHAARTVYNTKKEELGSALEREGASFLSTLGVGEVSFSSIKNETATVLGYFRNYFGVVRLDEKGDFQRFDLLIDINSLDTAVPGRNNRILGIFFESMKPELGTAVLQFDRLDLGGKSLKDIPEGETDEARASGNLTLNGVTQKMEADLNVKKQGSVWIVETKEPVSLLISDFGFVDRAYALMKECNHKSLGNKVKVSVKLYLK